MRKYKITSTVVSHGMTITLTIFHEFSSYEEACEKVVRMFTDLNWLIKLLTIIPVENSL